MILSSQFLRHRHFSRKLIATISTKLKREHLVDPDIVTTALSKETMFDFKEGKIAEVPIPPSVKKAGTIPDGFTIGEYTCSFVCLFSCSQIAIVTLDYHLDPNFAISTLAINGITTIESVHFNIISYQLM